MTKYIVDLFIPGTGAHYDVWLPAGKTIAETTELLKSIASSLSHGDYQGTVDSVLINAENGALFSPKLTVYDSGIRNSSRLILT